MPRNSRADEKISYYPTNQTARFNLVLYHGLPGESGPRGEALTSATDVSSVVIRHTIPPYASIGAVRARIQCGIAICTASVSESLHLKEEYTRRRFMVGVRKQVDDGGNRPQMGRAGAGVTFLFRQPPHFEIFRAFHVEANIQQHKFYNYAMSWLHHVWSGPAREDSCGRPATPRQCSENGSYQRLRYL